MEKNSEKVILELDQEFGSIVEVNINEEIDVFATSWTLYNPECPTGGGYYST